MRAISADAKLAAWPTQMSGNAKRNGNARDCAPIASTPGESNPIEDRFSICADSRPSIRPFQNIRGFPWRGARDTSRERNSVGRSEACDAAGKVHNSGQPHGGATGNLLD